MIKLLVVILVSAVAFMILPSALAFIAGIILIAAFLALLVSGIGYTLALIGSVTSSVLGALFSVFLATVLTIALVVAFPILLVLAIPLCLLLLVCGLCCSFVCCVV